MKVLDRVNKTTDLKKLDINQMKTLSSEIREEILSVTRENGGHLSANLGIVETTIALHYVFDFPKDKIVFDVGHQCYTHKLLSDRKALFSTIRSSGGLSGFPEREESAFDCFNTGHAGTSVSAGLGLCTARDLKGEDYCVVVVVGDGALTNGLNLEAINASSNKPTNFIVILNDNGMSISKNKNGFYKYISKSTTKKGYIKSKRVIKKAFGRWFARALSGVRDFVKRIFNRYNYFEKCGFKYVGIIDGNDVKEMTKTLAHVKEACKEKAIFLHVKTTKGKGYEKAEENADAFHGVSKNFEKSENGFSKELGQSLSKIMEEREDVVAITAAMKDGTGLSCLEERFSNRLFDVGIAEEFAVTLSAGMAVGGIRPIVAIYSTFLQRAYDQIIHDVCLQNLPVIFCIDRAGLNGEDGKTHQGVFDLSFLSHAPNLTILTPVTEKDLSDALRYALSLNQPVAIRYPKKSQAIESSLPNFGDGSWQTLSSGGDLALLCVGARMVALAEKFKKQYQKDCTIIAVRKVKPLDENCLDSITAKTVFTLEENSLIGGFGEAVSTYYSDKNADKRVVRFGVPDRFIGHARVEEQFETCRLTVENLMDLTKEI